MLQYEVAAVTHGRHAFPTLNSRGKFSTAKTGEPCRCVTCTHITVQACPTAMAREEDTGERQLVAWCSRVFELSRGGALRRVMCVM